MYKKPVCYNRKGEILDLDNRVVSRFGQGHAKQARQYVIEFNKGTQYVEHPDVTIPEFLNTPAWKDVSWHNDATGRSEATDTPAGFTLGVWVWSSNPLDRECGPDGPRYIVIVEDESGALLEETEANTDAECLKVIQAMRAKIESLTKETPPQSEPEEVELIASGYEWDCPNCERGNQEIEIRESVTCAECGTVYNVGDYHHAHK